MHKFKHILKGSLFCPFLLSLFWIGCSEPVEDWKQLSGEALGTTYHIQYLAKGNQHFAQEEMDSIIEWMNHGLSTYQQPSYLGGYHPAQVLHV
jgi:hypothetical protein